MSRNRAKLSETLGIDLNCNLWRIDNDGHFYLLGKYDIDNMTMLDEVDNSKLTSEDFIILEKIRQSRIKNKEFSKELEKHQNEFNEFLETLTEEERLDLLRFDDDD